MESNDQSQYATSPKLRQWLMLAELAKPNKSLAVKELADAFGVGEKTIRRDLEKWREIGMPLRESIGRHGKKSWSIDSDWLSPANNFTFDEAIAMLIARDLLQPLVDTGIWQAANRAIRKIESGLPESAVAYLKKMVPRFHDKQFGYSNYRDKSDIIEQLLIGIEENRVVFITHQSVNATEPVTYDIYPYELCWHEGSLYLVGDSPSQHEDYRFWKLDRIVAAHVEEVRFQRRSDFDPNAFLRNAFGMWHGDAILHITIRFVGHAARIAEESTWHASQTHTPQKDGSLLVELDVPSTPALHHWLLRFGHEAEVIEPDALRIEMADQLRKMLEIYERNTVRRKRSSTKG